MGRRLCLGCMREVTGQEAVCPVCGHRHGVDNGGPNTLRPGLILAGTYLVGNVIGQGGFGITYIGYDMMLNRKVAIKEYYPVSTGTVTRDNRTTVVWSQQVAAKNAQQRGFDSFLKEARKMARLEQIPAVVSVRNMFTQNGTAYIVMDYIEGETLMDRLRREGPMSFDECVKLLIPIMHALERVHQAGIIHRDISPDNIMIDKSGNVMLLDLGAAKDLTIQHPDGTVSSQLVAKHGFSPPEQYIEGGNIGSWTDVYAMCATVFYSVTGKMPPRASDRTFYDTFERLSPLTWEQFDILSQGMAIYSEDRIQTIGELLDALSYQEHAPIVAPPIDNTPDRRNENEIESPVIPPNPDDLKGFLKGLIAVFAVLAALCGLVFFWIQSGGGFPFGNSAVVLIRPENRSEIEKMGYGVLSYEQAPFWGQTQYHRSDVKRVVFQKKLSSAPSNAFDVSAEQDRSILAWMDGGTLHVASNRRIAFNEDSSFLFFNFTNMKSIDFGDCIDTRNVKDMQYMFFNCSALTSLDISSFDTKNVTNMAAMFSGLRLTSLDVSTLDTSNVTNMYYMFAFSNKLTSLDLHTFDTRKVTDMSWLFALCDQLTTLNLTGFSTRYVKDMSYMFTECRSLKTLDLSMFDTRNVTNMSSMFNLCMNLSTLNLRNFNADKVGEMKLMFFMCGKLKNLTCNDAKILKAAGK